MKLKNIQSLIIYENLIIDYYAFEINLYQKLALI